MRMLGRLKLYLLGPELSIDKLSSEIKLLSEENFIVEALDPEDLTAPRKKSTKKKPNFKRDSKRKKERKTFCRFFDECCVKEEGSYLNTANLYEAYTNWISAHHAGDPISTLSMGKYMNQSKKIRTLTSKTYKDYHNLYLDINLKDKSTPTTKVCLGEIYRFYKQHFVLDNPPCDPIALDEIYTIYKNWCNEQGIQPVRFHGFSKSTRVIMKKSHLEFRGKSPKGGTRRWLTGYKFNQPIPK